MRPTRTPTGGPVRWDTSPNALFTWPLVSIGFAQPSLVRFSVSEEFMSASAVMHPGDEQMYADQLRYQKASADPTTVPSHSEKASFEEFP
jgi:NADH dehydrogenase